MLVLQVILTMTVLILRGGPAVAGVVISETEVKNGIDGSATLNKTVYVQGRKQKIETSDHETIVDLDQGRAYLIDTQQRSYREITFPSASNDPLAPGGKLGAFTMQRTGATRQIAGYSCHEYQGVGRMDSVDVRINQCISADAPGAKELATFQSAEFKNCEEIGASRRPRRRRHCS
jgi:hypothetical protein